MKGGGESWYAMAKKLADALACASPAGTASALLGKGALEDFRRMDDKRRAKVAKNAAKRAEVKP